ncbi:MAG: hypothetical protein FWG10_02970 [Eubacteriaceae bacterium]|nr:hypothetical protein [Eubacteriaceae bacterium]
MDGYNAIVQKGILANPIPPRAPGKREGAIEKRQDTGPARQALGAPRRRLQVYDKF